MKKRSVITVTVIAVLLILAVCLLPWPEKIDLKLRGWAVDTQGNVTEGATVHLEGWHLHYLLGNDQLDVKATVNDGKVVDVLPLDAPTFDNLSEGRQYAAGLYYDGEINGHRMVQIGFTSDWDKVVILSDSIHTVYAVTEGTGETLQSLQAFFRYLAG